MHGLHQVRARAPSDPIIPKAGASLEGSLRAWAYALALVVLALPFFNPDAFWQLAAGRWIWAHRAIARADEFSFTRLGAPWIDFEWLTQAVWYAVERASGFWGLWSLKCALIVAAFWPVDGLLRDKGASALARAAAAALWAAGALGVADLRPDLATLIFFGVLLRRLESGKGSFLFGFALFAAWANLHGGWPAGLLLYALYAVDARLDGRPTRAIAAQACGAACGLLLNPYGLGLLAMFRAHADPAARLIMEWKPPSVYRGFQLGLIAELAVVPALVAAAALSGRRVPRAPAAAAFVFGAASAFSARFGGLFATCAAALVFSVFPDPAPSAVAWGLAALTPMIPFYRGPWSYPFHGNYVDVRAVEFVARERAVLGNLRLLNQYEWGGALEWRLGPGWRVFDDGRYLFARQLAETQDALDSPEALAELARRRRLDGFLIADYPAMMRTVRVAPDGSRREMSRPWDAVFFPRGRWALVYWDGSAVLYVDRGRVPAAWLAAHEYRWWRPRDGAALEDARGRGEVPEAALAAERKRQRAEASQPARLSRN